MTSPTMTTVVGARVQISHATQLRQLAERDESTVSQVVAGLIATALEHDVADGDLEPAGGLGQGAS